MNHVLAEVVKNINIVVEDKEGPLLTNKGQFFKETGEYNGFK